MKPNTVSRNLQIILCLFLGLSATGQTRCELQGTVINSVTGQPVSRALVQIGEPVQQSVLTGTDGSFHFDGVPAGETVVKAQKPGFLGNDLKNAVWSQAIEIGPKTRPVTVQLVPKIVIEGRVEIEGEEPEAAPYALYEVLHVRIENGRKAWDTAASGNANQDGQFRVSSLPPGNYYVGVEADWSTSPEYPVPYSQVEGEIFRPPAPGSVLASLVRPNRAVSPFVFYPGNANPGSAPPIPFIPGKRTPLVFSIKRPKLYKVSGTVSGGSVDSISVVVFDEFGRPCSTSPRWNPNGGYPGYYPGGNFVATLPAGKYVFRAYQTAQRPVAPILREPALNAEVPVNLDSDIAGLQIHMVPAVTIPVIVRTEFTKKSSAVKPYANFQWATAALHPLDIHHQDSGFKNTFNIAMADPPKIRDVPAGRYALEAVPNAEGVYIYSARSGAVDLLREELVVPAGGQMPPIEIVLHDDGGAVTGNVKGTAGHSAKLVIVPQFAPMVLPAVVTPDERGNFHSPALAPGEYKVFGFDSLENIEYANPAALDSYEAIRVKVLPHGSMNVVVQANKVLRDASFSAAGSGK